MTCIKYLNPSGWGSFSMGAWWKLRFTNAWFRTGWENISSFFVLFPQHFLPLWRLFSVAALPASWPERRSLMPGACRSCLDRSKVQRPQIACFATGASLVPPHPECSLHRGIYKGLYQFRHARCGRMSQLEDNVWRLTSLIFELPTQNLAA